MNGVKFLREGQIVTLRNKETGELVTGTVYKKIYQEFLDGSEKGGVYLDGLDKYYDMNEWEVVDPAETKTSNQKIGFK